MQPIVPKSPEGAPKPADHSEITPTPIGSSPSRWELWFTLAALGLFIVAIATVGPTREVVVGFVAVMALGLGRSVSDWLPWK